MSAGMEEARWWWAKSVSEIVRWCYKGKTVKNEIWSFYLNLRMMKQASNYIKILFLLKMNYETSIFIYRSCRLFPLFSSHSPSSNFLFIPDEWGALSFDFSGLPLSLLGFFSFLTLLSLLLICFLKDFLWLFVLWLFLLFACKLHLKNYFLLTFIIQIYITQKNKDNYAYLSLDIFFVFAIFLFGFWIFLQSILVQPVQLLCIEVRKLGYKIPEITSPLNFLFRIWICL